MSPIYLTLCLIGSADGPPPRADVITPLIAALREPDPQLRSHIAAALAAIGSPTVDPLLAALGDKDRIMRANAAYAISQVGLPAIAAKEPLLKMLKDDDREVRRQAAFALSKLLQAERDQMVPATPAPPPAPDFPAEKPRP